MFFIVIFKPFPLFISKKNLSLHKIIIFSFYTMIVYNRYINQEDHVWYDSSNLIYSKCYDRDGGEKKTLKIVFKGGRTYLYSDVDVKDYMMLKTNASTGKTFNEYIKKYDNVRIGDTDLDKLSELRESFETEQSETEQTKFGDLCYHIKMTNEGDMNISMGDKILFTGKDRNFSILDLFKSLNIRSYIEYVEKLEEPTED